MKVQEIKKALDNVQLEGKTQAQVAQIIGVTQSEISRCLRYYGLSWDRQTKMQDGEANSSFKNGLARSTIERKTRSLVIQQGKSLTTCERCNFVGEEELPRHHKDRDRSNNTIENIEVLCRTCHNKEHIQERSRDNLGRLQCKVA